MIQCAAIAVRRGDLVSAEVILQEGVDQHWAPAMFWLAWYRHKHSGSREAYRTILPLLESAAQQGHPAAQMILGRLMAKGKFGIRQVPAGWRQLHRLGKVAASLENAS